MPEPVEPAHEPIKWAGPNYLTALQVAELLQVDEKTVLRWSLQDASMPVLRRGRVGTRAAVLFDQLVVREVRQRILYRAHRSSSQTFFNASHAARCVACQGVRSHPVPVALVGECSIPVV